MGSDWLLGFFEVFDSELVLLKVEDRFTLVRGGETLAGCHSGA